MRPTPPWANGEPASVLRADAGFTLIEVIVAIVLIGASLLTVIGAAAAAFGFQAVARQQQVATTIATRKLEEVRALKFAVVSAGMPVSQVTASDTNLVKVLNSPPQYGLAKCGSKSLVPAGGKAETIPTTSTAVPAGVLNPYSVKDGVTVDGVLYSWATYITRKSAGDPFHAVVCVTWTWKGAQRQSMVQTWIWSPQGSGCVGRPVSEVGGPCASVSATVPAGAIAISVSHNNGAEQVVSFAIAGASSQVSLSSTTLASGSYTYASVPAGAAVTVMPQDEQKIVTADDDANSVIDPYADTGELGLPAIPAAGGWQTPSAMPDFRIKYLAGSGRASVSAVSPGTSCLPLPSIFQTLITPWPVSFSPVCAAATVSRNYASWVDTRYLIGDGYYVRPFSVSGGDYFKFGTYAYFSGTTAYARATREFTSIRIGGIPTDYSPGTYGNAWGYPATQNFKDEVILDAAGGTATDVSPVTGTRVSIPASADCNGLPLTTLSVAEEKAYASGGSCSSSFTAPANSNTIKIAAQWGWSFVPYSKYPEVANASSNTFRSSSPTIEITLQVTRSSCTKFATTGNGKNQVEDRSACSGAPNTDTYLFRISVSLGTSSVNVDKQL